MYKNNVKGMTEHDKSYLKERNELKGMKEKKGKGLIMNNNKNYFKHKNSRRKTGNLVNFKSTNTSLIIMLILFSILMINLPFVIDIALQVIN